MKTFFSFAMADASEQAKWHRWSKDIKNVKLSPSVTMPRKVLQQKCWEITEIRGNQPNHILIISGGVVIPESWKIFFAKNIFVVKAFWKALRNT